MTEVNISVTGGMAEGISGRFAIHRDKQRMGRSLPRWLVRVVIPLRRLWLNYSIGS